MKIFWSILSIWFFLTLQSTSAEEENTDYCNQQLIQASLVCLKPETLEICISDILKTGGCEIEIVAEEEIHICNEECAPDLTATLSDEKKNILSLIEGE